MALTPPPHLQEVVEVLEDADADLIQVFEEAVENGHQVGRRQLVAEDHGQLVDGEGQCAANLPLEERERGVMTERKVTQPIITTFM